jgi:DNA-binding response OmpR family regulator
MSSDTRSIRVLLVDDEEDFRLAAQKALGRRGFDVFLARSGEEALAMLHGAKLDLLILDLKMPGLSGLETLEKIRKLYGPVPVLILTGHGGLEEAMEGINMSIVDFVQKPVDMDELAVRIRKLLDQKGAVKLRERGVAELMASPDLYPRLYEDEPVEKAARTLWEVFNDPEATRRIRSARLYDRQERFCGLLRFNDLLEMMLPEFLGDSPYTTYFTGMFLAQSKVLGKRRILDLLGDGWVWVTETTPLMEAVHIMVQHRLISLPVLRNEELVGVLRETDLVGQILENLGGAVD